MLWRLTEPSAPEAPKPPKGATRRPLSSTSVYFSSRPWMAAVELPLPLPLTELDDAWKLPPVIAGSFWISSVTDAAPVLSMASRVMTVMGSAPSASIRLMEEPVISTRWTSGAVWAQALDAAARISAVQILVGVNMEFLPRGGDASCPKCRCARFPLLRKHYSPASGGAIVSTARVNPPRTNPAVSFSPRGLTRQADLQRQIRTNPVLNAPSNRALHRFGVQLGDEDVRGDSNEVSTTSAVDQDARQDEDRFLHVDGYIL